MRMEELRTKIINYVEEKKFNQVEGQSYQSSLVSEVSSYVRRLLIETDHNDLYTYTERNHIYVGDYYNKYYIDIKVSFKMGNAHSRYDYVQYYYINDITIESEYATVEEADAKRKYNNAKRAYEKEEDKRKLVEFMEEHNLTKEQLGEIAKLYNTYRWDLK